jgi:hypothetical protein
MFSISALVCWLLATTAIDRLRACDHRKLAANGAADSGD